MLYPPYTPSKEKMVRRGFGLPDPRDVAAKAANSVRRFVHL